MRHANWLDKRALGCKPANVKWNETSLTWHHHRANRQSLHAVFESHLSFCSFSLFPDSDFVCSGLRIFSLIKYRRKNIQDDNKFFFFSISYYDTFFSFSKPRRSKASTEEETRAGFGWKRTWLVHRAIVWVLIFLLLSQPPGSIGLSRDAIRLRGFISWIIQLARPRYRSIKPRHSSDNCWPLPKPTVEGAFDRTQRIKVLLLTFLCASAANPEKKNCER